MKDTEYIDLLLRVYAPSNDSEITRLLKTNGFLLLVTPSPRHLLQMTPYAWRAKAEIKNKIQRANGLEIEIDFILSLAVKNN